MLRWLIVRVYGYCPDFAIQAIDRYTEQRAELDIAKECMRRWTAKMRDAADALVQSAEREISLIRQVQDYEDTLRAISKAKNVGVDYAGKLAKKALERNDKSLAN